MGTVLRVRLPCPLTASEVRRLCTQVQDQLAVGSATAVVCTVDGGGGDLVTVDAVARLALVARRAGVTFTLDRPPSGLTALLDLVGLRAQLAAAADGP